MTELLTASVDRLPTGTLMGPYEIVGFVGEGGMGEVYRARDTRSNSNAFGVRWTGRPA